jgi:phosphate transport system protein
MENLKRRFLALSAVVEENVQRAIKALVTRDPTLAAEVIRIDDERIDGAEVDVEEECLKILALHQPVASDLRFIICVLKINNDLERVGDKAVNIAERAAYMADTCPVEAPFDIPAMAVKSQSMLKRSLDALVNLDVPLAREVLAEDDEMDCINRNNYLAIQDRMRADAAQVEGMMHYLAVSRQLERIADHATNIAEDVIYMAEGEIVRHRAADYQSQC